VEGILSEGMTKAFQIHFFTPQTFIRSKVLTMFDLFISRGLASSPACVSDSQELNFVGGNSSLCLKAEVSLPQM